MGETTVTVPDDSIQQRMQRLVVSQQQCVDRIAQVDTGLEQFRQAIRQDAFEIALTVQRVIQNLHGQGRGMEQIRHTLFNIVQEKVKTLDARFQKYDEFVQTVLEKTDKNTREVCSSVSRIIDGQADVRKLVEELARHMDNTREQTHSEGTIEAAAQEELGVVMQLEVYDLKTKVLRLTEQITDHTAKVNFFSIMSEKVDLMERQIQRWRYRLPDLTDDESQEPVVSAIDVREELNKFQDLTMSKVRDVRQDINSLDGKVHLLERARSDSWEVISQRLGSMVGDSVGALSDRLTDLEQTVQSRRTTPVTDASASQVPVEALTSIDQAFTHEVGRMKDEHDKSMLRQCDLLERLDQKQRSLEKQLTGLTSFARRVEKFLEQSASEGAAAPVECPRVTRHASERPTAMLDQTPGASSSSTRPPPYVQAPEPPSVPAPPVPRDVTPPGGHLMITKLAQRISAQCGVKSKHLAMTPSL